MYNLQKKLEAKYGDVLQAGHELRINCPFCPDKVGSPDVNHKLYINADTCRWLCFRCTSRGVALERLGVTLDVGDLTGQVSSSSIVPQVRATFKHDYQLPSTPCAPGLMQYPGHTDNNYYIERTGSKEVPPGIDIVDLGSGVLRYESYVGYNIRHYTKAGSYFKPPENTLEQGTVHCLASFCSMGRPPRGVIIVEGMYDLVGAWQTTGEKYDLIALCGKYMHKTVQKFVRSKYYDQAIYVLLDPDGIEQAFSLVSRLSVLCPKARLQLALPYTNNKVAKDPGELLTVPYDERSIKSFPQDATGRFRLLCELESYENPNKNKAKT